MPKLKREDLPREFEYIWSEMSSERMRDLMNELRLWINHKKNDESLGAYRAIRDSLHFGSVCRFHNVGRVDEGTVVNISENRISLKLESGQTKSIPISKLYIEGDEDA